MTTLSVATLSLGLAACGDDDASNGTDGGNGNGPADVGPGDTGAGDAGPGVMLRSAEISMTSMTPHLDQLMEFRLIDQMDTLLFRGRLSSLPSASYTYEMPNSVPEEAGQRLDFFADLNQNGAYDAPPDDHAWTLDLPATGTATLAFDHNTNFDDIDDPAVTEPGGDFTLSFSGMDPHLGQMVEIRVIMAESGRVVGRWVNPSIDETGFAADLPGIIQEGVAYQVDFFADLNEDGSYDAPPTDHAWRLTGAGNASGLDLTFTHNTDFTDVGF